MIEGRDRAGRRARLEEGGPPRAGPHVQMATTQRILAGGAVLALVGFGLAACSRTAAEQEKATRQEATGYRGLWLAEPQEKPDFTLRDLEGREFRFREETDGQLTLLFFGYTHCPDVCPVHMANLAAVLPELPYEVRSRLKVVFVTVDPARDTPARLKRWLGAFDPSFIGLVGDTAELRRVQEALDLPPAVLEPPDAQGNYTVGHSANVLAFTPDNRLRVLYPFGTRQADWAHDLPRLAGIGAGDVVVSGLYVPAPPVPERAALFLTVADRGGAGDALVGAATDAARRVELHRSVEEGSRVRMEPVAEMPVPARGELRLRPGGWHLMLHDLARPLAPGDTLEVELRFRAAGVVRARALVVSYAELESRLGASGDAEASHHAASHGTASHDAASHDGAGREPAVRGEAH